jgi:hypothetical protein
MGKQKKPSLAIESFPLLTWDEFFWASTITLPAWKGFQCRLGPYASRQSRTPSDGTTRLSVASPGKDSTTPPSAEQAEACRYLLAHQDTVRDSILRAVFYEYPDYRAAYYEDNDLDDSDGALPVLDHPEELRELIGLSSVLIHHVTREGIAYVGYEFGCAWEEEHGLGAMTHRDRVVTVGGADVSILEWIAEGDAKSARGKKRGRGSR